MANQLILKKGLDAARTVITPAEGELVYATDTKKVFVGDGATVGGNAVAGSNATHTGEVTGSGALTITAGAVTLAKMANGTAGNLIAFSATGAPAAVATGTAGQVLTSNGAGAAPTMQTPAGGGAWNLISTHVWSTPVSSVDINIPISTYEDFVLVINELGPLSALDYVSVMGSYDGGTNFELYMISSTSYFGNNTSNTVPMQDDGTFNMARTVKLGASAIMDQCAGSLWLHNATTSEKSKFIMSVAARDPFSGLPYRSETVGMFALHKTINFLRITTKAGATMNSGRLRLYGVSK